MSKPWQDESTEVSPDGATLKPWDHGFDADELPKTPAVRRPKGTGRQINADKRLENFKGRQFSELSPEDKAAATEKAVASRAATQERVAKRIVKGQPVNAKHFLTAHEVMEAHDFDPMELLMKVAQGEALYDDHPFMPILEKYLTMIEERIEFDDGFGVKGLMGQLRVEACGYLVDSYTPKEHRINVAKELLQYARPKLKQTEHITRAPDDEEGLGRATPLTEEDIQEFDKWFNTEY